MPQFRLTNCRNEDIVAGFDAKINAKNGQLIGEKMQRSALLIMIPFTNVLNWSAVRDLIPGCKTVTQTSKGEARSTPFDLPHIFEQWHSKVGSKTQSIKNEIDKVVKYHDSFFLASNHVFFFSLLSGHIPEASEGQAQHILLLRNLTYWPYQIEKALHLWD